MSSSEISLRAAFNNIFTEKYNKNNVFQYFVMIFILGIISAYSIICMNSKPDIEMLCIIGLTNIICIAVSILIIGIHLLGTHNGYIGKYQVLPDIVKDIKEILLTGIKFYGGFLVIYILTIILMLIFFVIAVILCLIGKSISDSAFAFFIVLSILAFILLLIPLMLLYCGLMFNYAKTLNIEDMINVKKAFILIKVCLKEFLIYFLKCCLVGIIAGSIAVALFIITALIISAISAINGVEINDIQGAVIYIASFILYSMMVVLLQMDLSIQFLLSTKNKIQD